MFVEVDFGEPVAVDSIQLDSAADQWNARLTLEGLDREGRWRTLAEVPAETRIDPPPNLRRLAALEIKYAGVRYLLIHENEFGQDDYIQRKQDWGLALVGEIGGKRLYRIE